MCRDSWNFVNENKTNCLAGSVAVISLAPLLYYGGISVINGVASLDTDGLYTTGQVVNNLIAGDIQTICNFAYIGVTCGFAINNVLKDNKSDKPESGSPITNFFKGILWGSGLVFLNVVTRK